MPSYSSVLQAPGVLRVLASQLAARLPAGMTALAILLHVQAQTGSYALAGLAVAVLSLGQAIAGPVGGRAIGRWGARPVLAIAIAISATATATIALLPLDGPAAVPLLLATTALVGLTTPPVQPTARTLYPRLVDESRVVPLLAIDASLQEIIFVVAPVVAALVAGHVSTAAALLVVAAILVAGGLWFLTTREVGQVRIDRSDRPMGAVALRPAVLIGVVVGFLLVGASAAVEVAVVAVAPETPLVAGVLLAVYSLASLIGGLAIGHVAIGPWSLARRLAVVALGLAVCVPWMSVWTIGVGLVIAGLGVAPVFAVTYALVVRAVPATESPEAFGWLGTGALVGAAAGSALAGVAIEAVGPGGAFITAAALATLGTVVAIAVVRVIPVPAGSSPS